LEIENGRLEFGARNLVLACPPWRFAKAGNLESGNQDLKVTVS
jgi:hypothetical protein